MAASHPREGDRACRASFAAVWESTNGGAGVAETRSLTSAGPAGRHATSPLDRGRAARRLRGCLEPAATSAAVADAGRTSRSDGVRRHPGMNEIVVFDYA